MEKILKKREMQEQQGIERKNKKELPFLMDEEKEEKLNAINEKFLECDKIQSLNLMLQRMYKYLLYEEWIDANLKLTWL